jgi:hypothetical protein
LDARPDGVDVGELVPEAAIAAPTATSAARKGDLSFVRSVVVLQLVIALLIGIAFSRKRRRRDGGGRGAR